METAFYTPREIAEIFKVAPYTVADWIRKGELKATRIGTKLWRISEKDLLNYLHTQEANEDARTNKSTLQCDH